MSKVSEEGTTFKATFVDGTAVEVRNENFYMSALIKIVHQYMMKENPDYKMSDLVMTDLSYWNGTRMEFIFKNTRFALGVH